MLYFQIVPTLEGILFLIPAIILTFIAASGVGLFLAALNVKYRDVKQALPFFIQTGLFLTPVIYPVSQVPQSLQWVLYLNPMTGIITVMRSLWLHLGQVDWVLFSISAASAIFLFVFGLYYFKAKEREFADII